MPWPISGDGGGVLEHPAHSSLWEDQGLPTGRHRDEYGGWTLHVDQVEWGHPCQKSTFLYIVGVEPNDMPPLPLSFARPTHVIESNRARRHSGVKQLPYLPKSQREHTPPAFAEWLVEVARRAAANIAQREAA